MSHDRPRFPPDGIPFDVAAARTVSCPVCHAAPGVYCAPRRPRRPIDPNRPTGWVHLDRVVAAAGFDPAAHTAPEDQ